MGVGCIARASERSPDSGRTQAALYSPDSFGFKHDQVHGFCVTVPAQTRHLSAVGETAVGRAPRVLRQPRQGRASARCRLPFGMEVLLPEQLCRTRRNRPKDGTGGAEPDQEVGAKEMAEDSQGLANASSASRAKADAEFLAELFGDMICNSGGPC